MRIFRGPLIFGWRFLNVARMVGAVLRGRPQGFASRRIAPGFDRGPSDLVDHGSIKLRTEQRAIRRPWCARQGLAQGRKHIFKVPSAEEQKFVRKIFAVAHFRALIAGRRVARTARRFDSEISNCNVTLLPLAYAWTSFSETVSAPRSVCTTEYPFQRRHILGADEQQRRALERRAGVRFQGGIIDLHRPLVMQVTEPGSLGLVLLGIVGAAGLRRREVVR